MENGTRVWRSEVPLIDTGFLMADVLTVAAYFNAFTPDEIELRRLADALYGRVDWHWAQRGHPVAPRLAQRRRAHFDHPETEGDGGHFARVAEERRVAVLGSGQSAIEKRWPRRRRPRPGCAPSGGA